MQKALLVLAFLTTSLLASAQTGSISGTIVDAKTKEAIIGGSVLIQGTQLGTSTDIDGKFIIKNIKPGTYSLQITYIAYKTAIVPDVVVEATKITDINIDMQEEAGQLEEVVITGSRVTNTDLSMLKSIRENKLVVSGISAQQIAKIPDNDAAQVMKRVPGITIVDNRFVMVRGVPERYNQVMINGAIAPSTEIDKRSFSFDLIPSSAVDQLLIYKSGTAEYPGDFAGGVIQLVTKQTEDEAYIKFGVSTGFRTGTSFNDFYEANKSNTDFLGFDNGSRDMPSSFPTYKQLLTTGQLSQLRADAGKSLSNSFGNTKNTAPMDYGLNFSISRNFDIGSKVSASTLTVLGYSTNFQYYKNGFNRYSQFDSNPETPSTVQIDFKDNTYSHESKINLIHNWKFNIGDNHKIEFKNLFVQIGDNKTTLRSGTDNGGQPGLNNNYAYHYTSRTIYSGQLQGKFDLGADKTASINWLLGTNYVKRNEPDYIRFRTIFDTDRQQFRVILPSGTNPFDAGRFYSDLTDNGYSHALNFKKQFATATEGKDIIFKAGYYTELKQRNFNARTISYLYPGSLDQNYGLELPYTPYDQLFSPQYMFSINPDNTYNNGLAIQEGTRPSDSYTGKNVLVAGYASVAVPVGKFDFSAGIRLEYNNQEVTSYQGDSVITNVVTSPLPSLNIAYNLTERSLIRAAYGRTINRPEFRELAPFLFYQFEFNQNITGNRDLKTATIDNIDLRWEMYPEAGELISFGGFYKSFKDPIEFVQQNASGGVQFSYQNAPKAYSYGAEVEIRKSLASLGVSKFLRNMAINLNASLIKSEVDMGKGITFQERRRPLQGQSPYVINVGAYYNDAESGFSVNAAYNIFGNRIFSVGSVLYPSWIERPRNAMDVQVSKTFNKMEVKLSVQNLFNAKYRMYQDNDENQKIDEKIDNSIQQYKTGTLYQLSFNWKFAKE